MPNLTPIITTGLNGLVGSKLRDEFADRYEWLNLDITHPTEPVDITNKDSVAAALEVNPGKYIVHFAAYTDVTGAWQQTGDKNGLAYQVNVVGTRNLAEVAAETGRHLIHISTAYVFDGNKAEPYQESDEPQPIEWYGQTKWEAEQIVMASAAPWTILRIDQPFRSDAAPRPDIVRRVLASMKDNTLYPQFNNHFFGPTFIDDFVKVIDWVIRTNTTGLWHASNNESWSDFEFAKAIAAAAHLNYEVKSGDLNEYLKTAQRPYQRNTALNSSKLLAQLDFKPHTVKEALAKVEWEATTL